MGQRIPDITERFPEGFGGVDMTSRYYPDSPLEIPDYDEIPYENEERDSFIVGDKFDVTSIFTGGYHSYVVDSRELEILHCSAVYEEIDGVHEVKEDFKIHWDDEREMEYIVAWRYKGEEGRVYVSEVDHE